MTDKKTQFGWGFPIGFFVFAILGFLDSSYLTLKHFKGEALTCSLTSGCNTVTSSVYSEIFGIPVALFGVIYYLIMLFGFVLFVDRKDCSVVRWMSWFSIAGLFASTYFIILQLFVLDAICQYCMFSAFTSYSLFAFGMYYLWKNKQ